MKGLVEDIKSILRRHLKQVLSNTSDDEATTPDRYIQLFRFGITGGAGLVANLVLLSVIVEILGFHEAYAAILSTSIVLLGGFILTNWWVFSSIDSKDSPKGLMKRGISYYAIMLSGKGINYIIYLILLSYDIWYLMAWIIGSFLVFIGTFSANRFIWYRAEGSG